MCPIFYSRPNLAVTCHDRFSWFGVLGRRCRAYFRFLQWSRLSVRLCALTHRFRYRLHYACWTDSSFFANETADTGPPSPTIVVLSRRSRCAHVDSFDGIVVPKIVTIRTWVDGRLLTPVDISLRADSYNANAIAKARSLLIDPVQC